MSSSVTIEKPRLDPPDVWPPDDGDGGGGGGGDGSPEPHESGPPITSSRMATLFVLAMVTMFFAGWFSLAVILGAGDGGWPPPDFPDVRGNLWTSTIVIALSSFTGVLAARSAIRGRLTPLRYWLFSTLCLGFAFCATQAMLWRHLVELGTHVNGGNFGALFYSLTGLHVAHVVGGIVFLTLCFARAMTHHRLRGLTESVRNCMLYWHFVGVIWYVIFTYTVR